MSPSASPVSEPSVRLAHHVSMVDVDLVQINFATYFRWMDLGYCALLTRIGHPLSAILESKFATPAVDSRCSYFRPVGLDDTVHGTTWIDQVGRTSYVVAHRFEQGSAVVAEGHLTHVWIEVGPPATAKALPTWLTGDRVLSPPRKAER